MAAITRRSKDKDRLLAQEAVEERKAVVKSHNALLAGVAEYMDEFGRASCAKTVAGHFRLRTLRFS
jgi:hypothetical protein